MTVLRCISPILDLDLVSAPAPRITDKKSNVQTLPNGGSCNIHAWPRDAVEIVEQKEGGRSREAIECQSICLTFGEQQEK